MKKFFDEKITYGNKAVALILLSVIAFLCLNSHSLLSHDEMGTMIEARMPFGEMLRFLFVKDVHPPVHFVLLKLWLSVFGQSVFVARCFSFAGMIACAVFAYVKIRKLFDEKTAFWFVAFLLFSPLFLWLGRFIRMYSWTLFFTTAAFLSAETALRKNDKKEYVFFVVFAVLASWTHYYAALTCGIMTLIYLCRAYDSNEKELLKRFFICGVVLFFCVSPSVYVLSRQNMRAASWIPNEAFVSSYNLFFENDNFFGAILIFTAWAFGIQALMENGNGNEKTCVLTGLCTAVLVLCTGLALSVLWRPVIVERYLTATLGGVFLFFAFGAAKKRRNEIFFSVFLTLSFLWSFASEKQRVSDSVQPEFYQTVKANVAKNDVIIAKNWWMMPWLSYHFPDYTVFNYSNCPVCIFYDKGVSDKENVAEMLKTKRVFTTDFELFPDCERREIITRTDPYIGGRDSYILKKRDEVMSLTEITKCE